MRQNELPCANCGAPLAFSPGVAALECPHCGAENEVPPPLDTPDVPGLVELDYHQAISARVDEATVEETITIRCGGCGAEVGMDAGTLAEECPFCATPLAKEQAHTHRHPKPQGVLPFGLTEREARAKMKEWLGGLWFAPSGLSRYSEAGRPMQGVYLPHYTFDSQADASYSGARGDAYYVTRTRTVMSDGQSRQETYQERRIRWTPVMGRVSRFFDDVLVPASSTTKKAGRGEEGGQSWDLAMMEPYRPSFLAGFRAEAPSVELETAFGTARTTMEERLRRDVRFDIGGDEQRIGHMSPRFEAITFKHVLLPIWLAAYRYRNTPYRVEINGRTGRVSGERPYSVWKIAIAVVLGLAVAGGIGYLVATGQ